MYEIEHRPDCEYGFVVLDENGFAVGLVRVEDDAKEIVAALNFVELAIEAFPGFQNGKHEVPGADLVDLFNSCIQVHADNGRFEERRWTV